MKNYLSKLAAVCSILAVMGAGCFGPDQTPTNTNTKTPPAANGDTKPSDTKPSDTTPATSTPDTTTPPTTPDTGTNPDRVVEEKELPVIDGTWKTYTNASLNFSFQYPTRGRYAPEWNVSIMRADDARLENNCVKPEATARTSNGSLVVGDSTFCIVRTVDAGAGQRYYADAFSAPRSDRVIVITFNKRLANGDLFEDKNCHGKTVISSGTTCILFDEALYRAHLNQIVSTYRHE